MSNQKMASKCVVLWEIILAIVTVQMLIAHSECSPNAIKAMCHSVDFMAIHYLFQLLWILKNHIQILPLLINLVLLFLCALTIGG